MKIVNRTKIFVKAEGNDRVELRLNFEKNFEEDIKELKKKIDDFYIDRVEIIEKELKTNSAYQFNQGKLYNAIYTIEVVYLTNEFMEIDLF